jgi:tRNA-specific 2-thiouridylase
VDKPPEQTRVVVAMSGGVDSSVAAALLMEQGYQVIGLTMQLYDHGEATARPGACCAGQDIHDAARIAEKLGFPHYVMNLEDKFRTDVMEDFCYTYLAGQTPIPCVLCNQTVKFRDLLVRAQDLEADALVTGHYARRIEGEDGPEMHRALDESKDQSYFLFATTKEQLAYLRFPLGEMDKSQTRAQARRLGLSVASKPESQGICFVPEGSYGDFVRRMRPGAAQPGDIVDEAGTVLGHHEGIIDYTVGQRRGLGIGGGTPLYVLSIDPATRRVMVGPEEALYGERVELGEVNWLGSGTMNEAADESGLPVQAKLRSTQPAVGARLFAAGEGGAGAHLILDEPQAAIAPGQACVFYDGSHLLGGGWIKRGDTRS